MSITLNAKRNLSFDGYDIAVVPHSDIAGRYMAQKYGGQNDEPENTSGANTAVKNSQEPTPNNVVEKPVPAPRKTSLIRRPSSAGIPFSKQILTGRDLAPTGPPDRTYKVMY